MPPSPPVHAILPLALLEAIRNLDTPIDDGLADLADEIVSKRLGLSATVASQIERYRAAATQNGTVDGDEAASVFRLVSRRSDAALVFADAGRRAARHAARTAAGFGGRVAGLSPRRMRRRLGFRAAARVARKVFGADLRPAGFLPEVALRDSLAGRAGVEGAGCVFYGAVFAELLRVLGGFEGAMLHEQCRSRGDGGCVWRATSVEGYE